MKFCQPHWEELRAAIQTRGLNHLVARSGEEATQRLRDELEGTADNKTFDPLMAAHNQITARALEAGGIELLSSGDCPLCFIELGVKNGTGQDGAATNWISGCTDSILEYCTTAGLIVRPQA